MATYEKHFDSALRAAYEAAERYIANLDGRPVAPTESLEALRSRLAKPLAIEGLAPEEVIADLVRDVEGGIMGSASGRFFGWVIGGTLPAAMAADWLTAAWDQNATLYACGPAASIAEEVVGTWLKQLLGLPNRASFALVNGCQLGHVTCLAAARNRLLQEAGWNVECNGLWGAPRLRILAGRQRHGSIDRAARLLGIGYGNIYDLDTDDRGRMRPEALLKALEKERRFRAIVVLQAGEINTGACDPFRDLIPIAKRYDAWVHVDGAFGLWAAASARQRHLVAGMREADSWVTDGHKWLNVPFDCAYAFIAQAEVHRAAMSHRASYLVHSDDARDAIDWNPDWSRRARSFPTYAALRQLGRSGVAELIDRSCQHAHDLVTRIGRLPGAVVLSEAILNQGLVRFLDPTVDASERDHGRWTDEVIRAIAKTGEAFFSGSDWMGRRAMRVSVCNWRTTGQDVERAAIAVERVLNEMNRARGDSLRASGLLVPSDT